MEQKRIASRILSKASELEASSEVRCIKCIDEICPKSRTECSYVFAVTVVNGVLKIEVAPVIVGKYLRRSRGKRVIDDDGGISSRIPNLVIVMRETEPEIVAQVRRNHRAVIQGYAMFLASVMYSLFR